MTRKFISLAMVIVTLDVYIRSQLHPNDPLFLFISNTTAVNIGMVLLVGLVVAVSFKDHFRSWIGYAGSAALALILTSAGIAGFFSSGFSYWLSGLILPLNSLMILEAGVILGICALSYPHPARLRIPLPQLIPRLAFLVPRIPHSPLPNLFRALTPGRGLNGSDGPPVLLRLSSLGAAPSSLTQSRSPSRRTQQPA
jgi:hypothetical protein